jgi:bacillithiol biosynthesis cysteine-adding enzyme BshC
MVQNLRFDQIPQQSALYLSYLSLSPKALAFYQHQGPTLAILEKKSRSAPSQAASRQEMASILRRQNEAFGCGERTLLNIEDLRCEDAVAILTGQQVGLFTGPLYTIYKAITAIRIADELRSRGLRAIPIFWMDAEDHDLAEVTHLRTTGPQPPARAFDFKSVLFPDSEPSSRSVGSLEFPESIRGAVTEYVNQLPDSGWREEIRAHLESACSPGTTFCRSFAEIMAKVLVNYGLVLFDPQDIAAKKLVGPIFSKAAAGAEALYSALVARNHELESAGFHAQVSLVENSTTLFFLDGGARKPVTREGGGFALKNASGQFSREEMIRLAETAPEQFSPNVLLRPIIQDFLFPTIAYVGGPAEVAYFAQIEVLYRFFDRPMPVIWPRASFTLLEPVVAQTMERHHIDMADILRGRNHLMQKIVHSSSRENGAAILVRLRERLDRGFAELQAEILALDASLVAALENAKKKVLHNIDNLQAKAVKREAQLSSSILTEVQTLLDSCFPEMTLQERQAGVHSFLAHYGPTLVDRLYSLVSLDEFVHQVITLNAIETPPTA